MGHGLRAGVFNLRENGKDAGRLRTPNGIVKEIHERNGLRRDFVHHGDADELVFVEVEPLAAEVDWAGKEHVVKAGDGGALQFPAAVLVHEELIAVVKFDDFAHHEKRVQLGAYVFVFAEDAALASGGTEFFSEHAEAAALAALRTSRTEKLPTETTPAAQEEVGVFVGINFFDSAHLERSALDG